MAGRGLLHTGGTLDKVESIPGFCIEQTPEQVLNILENVGCCIVGQTKDIAPADRVMYGIRDETGSADSSPLIAGYFL